MLLSGAFSIYIYIYTYALEIYILFIFRERERERERARASERERERDRERERARESEREREREKQKRGRKNKDNARAAILPKKLLALPICRILHFVKEVNPSTAHVCLAITSRSDNHNIYKALEAKEGSNNVCIYTSFHTYIYVYVYIYIYIYMEKSIGVQGDG